LQRIFLRKEEHFSYAELENHFFFCYTWLNYELPALHYYGGVVMSEKWKDRLTDQLCKAFLSLENQEEAYSLLEDVATIGEIRALAQRLEVARLLSDGYTYPQIAQQTGASTATISRVKKFLEYGADGYKLVLDRIKE